MPAQPTAVPSYLAAYRELYGRDPRAAARAWFADARFGLFIHYGLYSILGRGEWAMYHEAIPVAEYERLFDQFHPDRFDADFISDLALEAEMKYITITTRHHDSFCLFDTQASDYHSVRSPVRRDLVGELAGQCAKKGLGCFLYYSYALDWRHPYFYPRSYFRMARPDIFPIHETYAMIRQLQPQALICFKQGATGTEDFAAPERHGYSLAQRCREMIGQAAAEAAQRAWDSNKTRHNEICDMLQPGAWGYRRDDDAHHHTPDEVLAMLDAAAGQNCNLLLNTGPLPDDSIHAEDVATLREIGRRLRA